MKLRSFQLGLVDTSLSIVGLVCLGFGVYYVALKELPLAVTALGAALVLLFASTIDRFESLKGLGIEAKTRKLDATIDKAELAISQLKALAELTGGSLISLTSSVGRWDAAPTVLEAYALSRKVLDILKQLKSSEDDIRTTLHPWARAAAIDLFHVLTLRLHRLISERVAALDATKVNLSSPDQLTFARKCQEALGYPGEFSTDMSKWQLQMFEHKALELFDGAPLLDQVARTEHRTEFARAAAEFKFLAANLDFYDTELWSTVRWKGR